MNESGRQLNTSASMLFCPRPKSIFAAFLLLPLPRRPASSCLSDGTRQVRAHNAGRAGAWALTHHFKLEGTINLLCYREVRPRVSTTHSLITL